MKDQVLKKFISNYNLQFKENLFLFIQNNPEDLTIYELSRISELVNNSRSATAAYYTDPKTLEIIKAHLPKIDKDEVRILEPSVGVGNFLEVIIEKYRNVDKLIIDVNDIDENSIEITKLLNEYRNIPSNVIINYSVGDFLFPYYDKVYDLVIGNPPFLKLNKKSGLEEYAVSFNDYTTSNLSGFFMQKATEIGDRVLLIMPKYFLSNPDFKITRDRLKEYSIEKIVDFGEKGFKGVLIETIGVLVDTKKIPSKTLSYSVTKNISNIQNQSILTSDEYPYWLLYRNNEFNKIAEKLKFGVFKVFRDRQLTKKNLKSEGDIPVIKSRNIDRDGTGISSIKGYDSFLNKTDLEMFKVSEYLNRDDVFLSPNMTYYPRVIRKPKGTLVNGSVAILEKTTDIEITDEQLSYFSSKSFEEFYKIARNYSTRSLNIDSNSVYFFGLKE